MKRKIKDAYVAGVVGIIIASVLLVMAGNSPTISGSQIFVVFGAVFGLLSLGCFIKPNIFGPVLGEIMDNIAAYFGGKKITERRISQKQTSPKHSPQITTGDGAKVTVKYGK